MALSYQEIVYTQWPTYADPRLPRKAYPGGRHPIIIFSLLLAHSVLSDPSLLPQDPPVKPLSCQHGDVIQQWAAPWYSRTWGVIHSAETAAG